MAYTKTAWVNGTAPALSAENMNKIETALYNNDASITALETTASATADYVVEQGTSGMWTYRKWNSGVMECWGTYSATIAVTTSAGAYGGYRSSLITADAFPYTFDSVPTVIGLSMTPSGVYISNAYDSTTTNACFYLACGSSTSSKTMSVSLYAVGTYS